MKTVAFVPIKFNSERLPGKMFLEINGKPLCRYIFDTLLETDIFNDIYVYCSNPDIQNFIPKSIKFLERPGKFDSNSTLGLEIYQEFVACIDADIYALVHATAPILESKSIEKGVKAVMEGYDSAFSVERIQTFCWYKNKPINYDLNIIPRTQDMEPIYVETSGFYIFTRDVINSGKRIGINPKMIEVSNFEAVDIDEQKDFDLASKIMNKDDGYINYQSSSTGNVVRADLGTIEADMCGRFGKFEKEELRGEKILNHFLQQEFETVLDIGAGALQHSEIFVNSGKIVDICDYGNSIYYKNKVETTGIRNHYIGDFNDLHFPEKYDAVWCCHILEHQLNVNNFLKKIHNLLKEGGYLCIVVPPRKPFIVGGHVTLWNAGLLMYNLILAGFDCSDCKIKQYDYNIGIILRKKSIPKLPDNLSMDRGDIELLSRYFPFDATHDFNGDIMEINWV